MQLAESQYILNYHMVFSYKLMPNHVMYVNLAVYLSGPVR